MIIIMRLVIIPYYNKVVKRLNGCFTESSLKLTHNVTFLRGKTETFALKTLLRNLLNKKIYIFGGHNNEESFNQRI